MKTSVGVIGASGFVGATLCERLYFEGHDFVPFVRSSGNAWRIARLPVRIRSLDLLDTQAVQDAVNSCRVIVNCALGSVSAMSRGFRNLVDASQRSRLEKFVHLSSIAVYGQDPAPDTVTEAARPNPGRNEYGRRKLYQDGLIAQLHRAGVPCYTLCPGNITGPYSGFLVGLAKRLAHGPLALVDEGRYASNLIHVDNLVEAILACLRASKGAGERYFVNETQPVPWSRVFHDLAGMLGVKPTLMPVDRDSVVPFLDPPATSIGLRDQLGVVMSADFRRALAGLPVFRRANDFAYRTFGRLPEKTQNSVRERLQWPIRIEKRAARKLSLDERYVTVQARRFYHSPEKLQTVLGWQPPLTYEKGLQTSVDWLRFAGIP